jgi:LytS/YehU family sensor histidine kinase
MENTVETTWGKASPLLSAHFIFNTLNIIQYHIILNDKQGALKCLNTFSKLFRQYITLSQSEVVRIEQEIYMVRLFLQLQQLRYSNKFEHQLICDQNFPNSAKIRVVQIVVIVEDFVESLMKRVENKLQLTIAFKEVPGNILMTMDAGNFLEGRVPATDERDPDLQETGILWRKHIETLNGFGHHQLRFSEEKVHADTDTHSGYRWRLMLFIPSNE